MTLIHGAMWFAVLLACVGVILWAYMNVRARRITSRLGAFRCWSRPDYHAGWTAGIGVYGVDELSWRFAWHTVSIVTRSPWNA